MSIEQLKAELVTKLQPAREIAAKAEREQRDFTPSERQTVKAALADAKNIQERIKGSGSEGGAEALMKALDDFGKKVDLGSGTDSLSGALKAEGFDRISKPAVEVGFKAATFSGTADNSSKINVASPPLGADARYLYPVLQQEGVPASATAVDSFRQKSRTLADPAAMIRAIDASTTKPSTSTETELVHEALKQIATINDGVKNIFLENQAFRSFIDQDLRQAYSEAVDFHVISEIQAALPQASDNGDNLIEAAVHAAEMVAAAGHNPRILAASPQDLIAIQLLRQPVSEDYVGDSMDRVLAGLRRVAVPGLTTPLVLDPSAAGTLYVSPVRFASFEENAGATNTSTIRIESNGLFVVQRPLAIAQATLTPPPV